MHNVLEAAPATASLRPEQVPQDVGSGLTESSQRIGHSVLGEMPAAHRQIDPATLTAQALIKKCPHYGARFEANPVQAEADAEQMVQKVRLAGEMRAAGKTDEEIRTEFLTDALAWLEAMDEPAPQERSAPKPAKADETKRAERRADVTAGIVEDVQAGSDSKPERVVSVEASEPVPLPSETVPSLLSEPEEAPTASPGNETSAVREAPGQAVLAPALRPVQPHSEPVRAAREADALPVSHTSVEEPVARHTSEQPVVETEVAVVPRERPSGSETDANAPAEPTLAVPNQEMSHENVLSLLAPPSSEDARFDEGTASEVSSRPLPQQELPEQSAPAGVAAELEQVAEDSALEKDSLELYDGFTRALDALIEIEPPEDGSPGMEAEAPILPGAAAPQATADAGAETATRPEASELEPVPPIAAVVATRLKQLEPAQETAVAPMLQEIVAAARIALIRQAEGAEPEAAEVAALELETQVTALFDYLEIAYEPEDVRRFVPVLLRMLQPAAPEAAAADVDLEHDGTREARSHAPVARLAGTLADAEATAERLLGRLVLALSHPSAHIRAEYELAA